MILPLVKITDMATMGTHEGLFLLFVPEKAMYAEMTGDPGNLQIRAATT